MKDNSTNGEADESEKEQEEDDGDKPLTLEEQALQGIEDEEQREYTRDLFNFMRERQE